MNADTFEHDEEISTVFYYADLAEPTLPSVEQVEEAVAGYLDEYFTTPDGITVGYEIGQVDKTGGYPGEFYAEYEITEPANSPLRRRPISPVRRRR